MYRVLMSATRGISARPTLPPTISLIWMPRCGGIETTVRKEVDEKSATMSGFQLNSEWVHSGATSGWWPADEPAGGVRDSNANTAAAAFVFELDLRAIIVQELEVERKHIDILERKSVQIQIWWMSRSLRREDSLGTFEVERSGKRIMLRKRKSSLAGTGNAVEVTRREWALVAMRGGGSHTDGRAIAIVLRSCRAAEVEGAEDKGQGGCIEVLKNTSGGEGYTEGREECSAKHHARTHRDFDLIFLDRLVSDVGTRGLPSQSDSKFYISWRPHLSYTEVGPQSFPQIPAQESKAPSRRLVL
ncbi:hypothetical protein C8F04DRAFT_1201239 [Mycena alexandri]|uniref:Uncharacterized protein n=1 Tax=Mycena alexandri TaxID=1745969 RepID=A0AAD6WMQ4_9AGAR|nr:hypothetical protein C8F04DRAFT_1201239 [Mycena alexandri]